MFNLNCQLLFYCRNCGVAVDWCRGQPCLHGGTCLPAPATPAGFTCECEEGWAGQRCEEEAEQCGGELAGTTGHIVFPLGNSGQYSHLLGRHHGRRTPIV